MHALRTLDRQRALLLKHDEVIFPLLHRRECLTCVPVPAKRCPAGADQPVLEALAPRRRKLRDQPGQIVAGGEAVADEQDVERGGGRRHPHDHGPRPTARQPADHRADATRPSRER
jgi:hypothetical protein